MLTGDVIVIGLDGVCKSVTRLVHLTQNWQAGHCYNGLVLQDGAGDDGVF